MLETFLVVFSVCAPGYYSADGGMSCAACGIGNFSNTTSNDPCFDCGITRSTVNANSTSISDCCK